MASHHPRPTTAAATMANHSERATSSIPKWLRPINGRGQTNRLGPAVFAAPTGTQTSRSNDDHIQTQRRPSVPQHEPEPSTTVHQTTPPALASDNSVVCAAKRKAPDVAPRDEEQQDCHPRHVTTNLKGRGGVRANKIWIDQDEGANIMMEATMALKNSRRRVTLSGAESHSKRARMGANDSNDDTEILLSWSSKVEGESPLVAQSGPPRYQKGIEIDSAMDSVTPAQIDMDSPEGCDFSLGTRDENAPSSKALENPGPPMLGEVMRPLQECVQPVLGGTQGQSSGEKFCKEKRCLPSVPEQGAHSSESRELEMDVALGLYCPPMPHELSTASLGDPPNIDNSPAFDPVDDTSDSDVPLALLVSLREKQRRAPLIKKPRRRTKVKGKAKADGCNSVDVDASRKDIALDVVDELEPRYSSPSYISAMTAVAAETSQHTMNPRTRTRRKMARVEDSDTSEFEALDVNLSPRATARSAPPRASKSSGIWRVVNPPSRGSTVHPLKPSRVHATDLRPRVWTGGKDELFAALPSLAKNRGGIACETLNPTLIFFSEEISDSGLGWWKDDIWEGRGITFSIVREVDVPLHPPVHCPISDVHGSSLDANPMPMDAPSLPARSSNSPAPLSTYNRQPPAILLSGQNLETTDPSSGLPEAGSSQVGLESPTNLPSSRVTGVMEVPKSGTNHSFPFHQGNLQFGYDRDISTGGRATMSSMSGDSDNRQDESIAELGLAVANSSRHPDSTSPGVQPVADVTRVEGLTALDRRSFHVDPHAIQSVPGVIPSSESHRSPLTWNSSKIHASQVDTCPLSGHTDQQSSALTHSNLIPHPCQPVTTSELTDSTTSCTTSLCHGSQGLHHPPFPQPPPEVTTLLMAKSSGDVLSPVFARNSPLVPWELPSEIGHFWSGLFKISEIKVETNSLRNPQDTLTVRRAWRFYLEWVPGGEDLLLDDGQHDYNEWFEQIVRPWWEPKTLLDHHLSLECSRLLLPLPLLAPFTENSTATGNFPVGYFCATCGRVNIQRFLRHRICESAACNTKTDLAREIGWVIGAFSTRDRKVNSATISPDDKWAAPTTAEPAVGFENGTRLFHYHLTSGDSGALMASASTSANRSNVETNPLSVRHIFNSNRAPLQASASALFETLQRDVRIERSIGATVFSTPLFESGDDPALRRNGRGMWDQQAGIIESALSAYCRDLGPLKVHSLRIHAWISDGKSRQMFCPRVKYLVLLCLGADITLLSILSDSDSKTNSKTKKECLRVTMVHGDIVVLSGSKFEFVLVRTGMCMLLEAECI